MPEALYPTLAVTLLSLGLAATGMFFVYALGGIACCVHTKVVSRYEVTKTRYSRKLTEELALGGASAVLLVRTNGNCVVSRAQLYNRDGGCCFCCCGLAFMCENTHTLLM